jgi:hypothetical protein
MGRREATMSAITADSDSAADMQACKGTPMKNAASRGGVSASGVAAATT